MLGHLFQCDPDIRLAGSEIYLDPAESRRIGIISHGHSDHETRRPCVERCRPGGWSGGVPPASAASRRREGNLTYCTAQDRELPPASPRRDAANAGEDAAGPARGTRAFHA